MRAIALPTGAIEKEFSAYIQGDGTAFVKTNVVFNPSTEKLEVMFKLDSAITTNQWIAGSVTYSFSYIGIKYYRGMQFGSNATTDPVLVPTTGIKYVGSFWTDGSTNVYYKLGDDVGTYARYVVTDGQTLNLLAGNSSGGFPATFPVYRIAIHNADGSVKADFRPRRISGVVGFIDIVGGGFYTNETGTLTFGRD